MLLVVDASVAVKFLVEEPGSDAAYDIAIGPDDLIAPDWLTIEVASALWKKVKYSRLLEIHAEDALASLPEFFDRLHDVGGLLQQAFKLSFRLRHPVYDCLYLALARREGADLVTADKDFHRAVATTDWSDRTRLLAC